MITTYTWLYVRMTLSWPVVQIPPPETRRGEGGESDVFGEGCSKLGVEVYSQEEKDRVKRASRRNRRSQQAASNSAPYVESSTESDGSSTGSSRSSGSPRGAKKKKNMKKTTGSWKKSQWWVMYDYFLRWNSWWKSKLRQFTMWNIMNKHSTGKKTKMQEFQIRFSEKDQNAKHNLSNRVNNSLNSS